MLEAEGNPSDPPKNDPPPSDPPSDPPKNDPPKSDPPPSDGLTWDQIKQAIPEELRNDKSLEPITSVEGLVKSYIHGQKAIGKDKISLPDKHATEEDWQEVFKKMGNPESLDEYKYSLEGDSALSEDVMDKVKEAAHKAGVLPWQFEKVVNVLNKEGLAQTEAQQTEAQNRYQAEVEKLQKEWGKNYDTMVRRANAAFKEFMPDKAEREAFIESGLGGDPRVVKILAQASKLLNEDVFIGQGDGHLGGVTPDEALAKARDIQGDPNHPYRNPSHPNHKSAKEEVAALYKIAFPE